MKNWYNENQDMSTIFDRYNIEKKKSEEWEWHGFDYNLIRYLLKMDTEEQIPICSGRIHREQQLKRTEYPVIPIL